MSSGLTGIGPDDRNRAGLTIGVEEFIESAGCAITAEFLQGFISVYGLLLLLLLLLLLSPTL